MLTFKRALIAAAAVLTFLFLLRHTQSTPDETRQIIHNADQMPKPQPFHTQLNGEKHGEGIDNAVPPPPAPKETDGPPKGEKSPAPVIRKPKTQIPLADLHKKPLRQQLEYQFPYDPQSKFPAYIWQTWKVTPSSGDFDEIFREPEASWTILHPTFIHEVITDSVAIHLMRHLYASVPDVLEAYNALPFPVMKADFFRYLILLARGGIYSDIDTAALKSATEWVPADVSRDSYGMVIGIEADPDREDWAQWYSRRIQFCQWTIQAKPGHPVLRDIVANITEETLKRKAEGRLPKDTHEIIEFTGPALWTDLVFKFFNNPEYFDMKNSQANITWRQFTGMKTPKKVGDVVVLPITSFSPGVRTMGAGEDDDPMAFVKHNFEGTWKPDEERHIGENNQ
ncbi:hypothetical protein NA57DRAFT_70809 [Rhizodiscina lignyota]|uniref:Initiation-specific alpha-1,6-mannosyltransferase n=1 Tax=Rhizodiscina lignyota TaxID=1504668 RepID=A0A9P4ISL2_9PEZI|nr:hypothetical protein NA57DRAFT_70809 [Rhizodiscina lignyota]